MAKWSLLTHTASADEGKREKSSEPGNGVWRVTLAVSDCLFPYVLTCPPQAIGRLTYGAEDVYHVFLVLIDGCHKLDSRLQASHNRKLFRRQEQSPRTILRRAVVA